MTTKKVRRAADRRQHQMRALARLSAQARLNAADAEQHGRVGEVAAWLDVAAFLDGIAAWARSSMSGIPRPQQLFEPPDGVA